MSTYYDIKIDGMSVYDPSDRYLAMIRPSVDLQLGAAGSAEFTFPSFHTFYDSIIPYGSDIEVFEDGRSIFFGRALPPSIDFLKNKSYHCEGTLAFLNDIIYPEAEMGDIPCGIFLQQILQFYNGNQTRESRKIYARNINDGSTDILGTAGANKMIYDLSISYESCFDLILNEIRKYVGGYFYIYRIQGKNYLDWVSDEFGEESNQEVVFKINLLDLMQSGKPFYTAVLPEGIADSSGNKPYFFNYVKMSDDIINKYGTIVAHKQFPYTNMATITGMARQFLQQQQINGYSFEVTALDRHIVDGEYDQFQIMQNVRVVSEPHAVDAVMPITKMSIDLNTPIKTVTIGTPEKISTTTSIKKIKQETKQVAKETKKNKKKIDSATGSPKGVLESPDGNQWEPSIDDEGNISYHKVPTKMYFTQTQPYWNVGDTFDLSKFKVVEEYGDGSTQDVTSLCQFMLSDDDTPEDHVFTQEEGNSSMTLLAWRDVGSGAGSYSDSRSCSTEINVLSKWYNYIKVEGDVKWGESMYVPRSGSSGGWTVKDYSGTYHYTLEFRTSEPFRVHVATRPYGDLGKQKYTQYDYVRSVLFIPDFVPLTEGRMSYTYSFEDGAIFEQGGHDFDVMKSSHTPKTTQLFSCSNSHTFWASCHLPREAQWLLWTSNYDEHDQYTPERIAAGKLGANGLFMRYPLADRPLDEWHEDFEMRMNMSCNIVEAEEADV